MLHPPQSEHGNSWYTITMRITSLEQQAHNPERFNIYVDGTFLLGIGADLLLKEGLHINQELSTEQIEQLKHAENHQQAIERAINYLSFRPRSEEEVRRFLRKKETPPEIIEAVLEHLSKRDYVNDKSFATFWVENRDSFNPRGAQALRNELRMKGVDREILEEVISNEHEAENALRAGRKKALSLIHTPNIEYKTFYSRLGGFLQRRGFSYDVISKTVRALWQELKEENADH